MSILSIASIKVALALLLCTALPTAGAFGQVLFAGVPPTDGADKVASAYERIADIGAYWPNRPGLVEHAGLVDLNILKGLQEGIQHERPGRFLEDARQEALTEAFARFGGHRVDASTDFRAEAKSIGRAAARRVMDARRQTGGVRVRHVAFNPQLGSATPPMEEVVDVIERELSAARANLHRTIAELPTQEGKIKGDAAVFVRWRWLAFERLMREHRGEKVVTQEQAKLNELLAQRGWGSLGEIEVSAREHVSILRQDALGRLHQAQRGRISMADAEWFLRRFEEAALRVGGDDALRQAHREMVPELRRMGLEHFEIHGHNIRLPTPARPAIHPNGPGHAGPSGSRPFFRGR